MNVREEITKYKPLKGAGDAIGLIAFYPLFLVVGYLLETLELVYAAEIYLFVFYVYLLVNVLKFKRIFDSKRFTYLSYLGFGIIGLQVLFIILAFIGIVFSLSGALIRMLIFVSIGLLAHDISKKGRTKLHHDLYKYGGLIILGAFIMVIPVDVSYIAGIILIVAGLSLVSQKIKYLYYHEVQKIIKSKAKTKQK